MTSSLQKSSSPVEVDTITHGSRLTGERDLDRDLDLLAGESRRSRRSSSSGASTWMSTAAEGASVGSSRGRSVSSY